MKTLLTLFAIAALGLACRAQAAPAAAPLTQGFDDIGALGGWLLTNQSSPAGQTWFQGNSGIFAAHAGAADSYIAANFLSAQNGAGTIDNWLISPELQFSGPTRLSFYTRGAGDPGFSDRLEVRFASGGGADTAGFAQTLLTVGGAAAYPDAWQRYSATVFGNGSGRFAFRYTGPAGGADYIGIDSVSLAAVPEPAGCALYGAGLALLGCLRARGRRTAKLALALAALGLAQAARAAEPPDGMVVVRDAETGALRPPTAAEYKALQALEQGRVTASERAGAAIAAPLVRKADGTLKAHLGQRGAVYAVATRDADGRTQIDCLPGLNAARAAIDGRRDGASPHTDGGPRHAID